MQASVGTFYAVAYQIQFWINLIIIVTAFVLLAIQPRLRGKLFLLGYVALLIVACVSWYVRDLLGRFEWLKWDSVLGMIFVAGMHLVSILGSGLLLGFAIASRWRSAGVSGSGPPPLGPNAAVPGSSSDLPPRI
jgi:hypothetical protein